MNRKNISPKCQKDQGRKTAMLLERVRTEIRSDKGTILKLQMHLVILCIKKQRRRIRKERLNKKRLKEYIVILERQEKQEAHCVVLMQSMIRLSEELTLTRIHWKKNGHFKKKWNAIRGSRQPAVKHLAIHPDLQLTRQVRLTLSNNHGIHTISGEKIIPE